MRYSNGRNSLAVANATGLGSTPRDQQLNAGMVAALMALVCMVFSSTPGLISALGNLDVSLPSLHASSSAKKASSTHAFRSLGSDTFSWTNRSAGVSGVVSRAGLAVRTASGSPQVSLRSLAFGRVGAMTALAGATPVATDETASIRHNGVIEWFQNRAGSLEQGWTIAKRPAG